VHPRTDLGITRNSERSNDRLTDRMSEAL
jgi:hypothetical protein